ncbi:MAG: hypothetical protein ACOX6D_06805 [Thermoguttaceae bacterium]|jgi:hypothetical protein
MANTNKNKEHWGNLVSSLEEKSDRSPTEETKAKPAKKRAAKTSSPRKRPEKKEKEQGFEQSLLDSLESPAAELDLTVGSSEKKEKKEKKVRRVKKSEKGIVEKAVAAEEEKDREKQRTRRKKLADAVVEKAKEPFREIASQIEERIATLTEEEQGEAESTEKKPSGKKSAVTSGKKASTPKKGAEPAVADGSPADFSWEFEETLEVSWGRRPERKSTAAAESEETSEEFPEQDPEDTPEADPFEVPESKKVKNICAAEKKLSCEEAEAKFASLFSEEPVPEESADEAPAASIDDNDFWGIPDEPELGFVTTAKRKEPKAKPEPEDFPSPATPEKAPEKAPKSREERRPRRNGRREESRESRPPRRTERGGDRVGAGAPRLEDSETEVVFPTWQDAIGDVVRGNIARRGNAPKGGGDRRRR